MKNIYIKAACLGVLSGMRSMAGPALASHYLTLHPSEALAQTHLKWLAPPRAALVTKFLAAGEIIGDKLPMIPNRTAPGPLLGRIISGGLCGAALCAAGEKRPEPGAVIGAAAAGAGAFGFYYLRRSIGKLSKIPDPYVGAMEDALVYGVGGSILK